jgi:hypothetical protein
MSQLVKTKRQVNFKDFKRFGEFKGLVEQKNVVFNLFVCKLGLFWHSWAMSYNVVIGCDIFDRFTMEHFQLRQRMSSTTKIYC